jgi:hypothetical protein
LCPQSLTINTLINFKKTAIKIQQVQVYRPKKNVAEIKKCLISLIWKNSLIPEANISHLILSKKEANFQHGFFFRVRPSICENCPARIKEMDLRYVYEDVRRFKSHTLTKF